MIDDLFESEEAVVEIDEMVEFDGDLWGVEVGENAKMWEREKEKEKEKEEDDDVERR